MSDGTRPTVLVVDDEDANLRTFARMFRREFVVRAARGADEALQALEEDAFAVALLDYRMPLVNGVTLAGQLQALRPGLPCVLLTGSPNDEAVQQAVADGVCEMIIGKPWSREEIKECVRRLAPT